MSSPNTADIYNLLTESSFCPIDTQRHESMSPGFLTGFIIFHIMNFSILFIVTCALLVHPFSKTKMKTLLSLCDIRTNWKWKKVSKKGLDGEPIREFKADEPKSVAGSVITLLAIWFLFGVLVYMTNDIWTTSASQMSLTESQDKASIQNSKRNLFNVAAVVKVRMYSGYIDCSSILSPSSFRVTGNGVVSASNLKTKYEYDSYGRRNCYIWLDSTVDASYLPSTLSVSISFPTSSSSAYSTSATFSLLSTPWNSQESDFRPTTLSSVRKSTANYLKSKAIYCANFDTNRGATVSISSEPKAFQYPDDNSYSTDPAFTNLVHFPSQFAKWNSGSSYGSIYLNVQLNAQRAFFVQSPPIWNILLVYVVVIAAALILVPWIRCITFLLISKYQRSVVWRFIVLGLFLLVAVGFYALMTVQISMNELFRGPINSSIALSGVIHASIYLFVLILNMAVYHRRYKEHDNALNAVTALPTVSGEIEAASLLSHPPVAPSYNEQHVIPYQPHNIIYPHIVQQHTQQHPIAYHQNYQSQHKL